MKAVILMAFAAATAVGIMAWNKASEPGADIRIVKSDPFVKSQSRLCAEDATDLSGCEFPGAD